MIIDLKRIFVNDNSSLPVDYSLDLSTVEYLGEYPLKKPVNINGTVVKTSVGAIYNMPIIRVVNLGNAIEKLKDIGYWIIGTDMVGTDYTEIDYNMPVCLVIGNEGKGISKLIKNNCDFMATIPMSGNINSLNASVSCGIILSRIVSSRR
jgi:23S rRNA (guanosine2251-2'-O)-methyltransferase